MIHWHIYAETEAEGTKTVGLPFRYPNEAETEARRLRAVAKMGKDFTLKSIRVGDTCECEEAVW